MTITMLTPANLLLLRFFLFLTPFLNTPLPFLPEKKFLQTRKIFQHDRIIPFKTSKAGYIDKTFKML